jgi:hypothetical protein
LPLAPGVGRDASGGTAGGCCAGDHPVMARISIVITETVSVRMGELLRQDGVAQRRIGYQTSVAL